MRFGLTYDASSVQLGGVPLDRQPDRLQSANSALALLDGVRIGGDRGKQ
jgi:hypothetical protein